MSHIAVLGSTNMDLVTHVDKAPQHGETVTGREFRTIPGGKGANQAIAAARAGATVSMIGALAVALGEKRPIREAMARAAAAAALCVQREGASASMPYRSEIEARYTS